MDCVISFLLIFKQDWCRWKLKGLRFVIRFSIDQFKDTYLVIVGIDFILLTDIRQLITLRVNDVEVWISNEMPTFCGISDGNVTFQCWNHVSWKFCYLVRRIQ